MDTLESFHCPSCREKQWDISPPEVPSSRVPSANVSRSASPSVTEAERHAASLAHNSGSDHGSPAARGGTPLGFRCPQIQLTPDTGGRQSILGPPSFPATLDPLGRAREFLREYGGFPPHQEYRQDLLHRLGAMMAELESNSRSLRELDSLREENARLKRENAELKASLNAMLSREHTFSARRSPLGSRAFSSSTSSIDSLRPPDAAERTWDRIITDVF